MIIRAEEPEQMKRFNWEGYCFDAERSKETEYIFIRTKKAGDHKHINQ